MNHSRIIDHLIEDLQPLSFGPPVTHVYNPLVYARKPLDQYLRRYGKGTKAVVLLGMNPGPWGMAQTGVPFGEIAAVTGWLNIDALVGSPENPHPKRPVEGFGCRRSEVSGKRLWGWARDAYQTPDRFFSRFFVANYCPLVFMEAGGRNRTPNNLPAAERAPLFDACDRALCRTVDLLKPDRVIGVGNFAAQRAAAALEKAKIPVGRISHPSPANPRANQGWQALIEKELAVMGIFP